MRPERAANFRTRLCRKRDEIVTAGHHPEMRFRPTIAAALAAALLAPGAIASLPRSGLFGIVTKGPTVPVCREGETCDAPVQVTLVFARAGRDVARVRSSAAGHYRIALRA